MTKEKGSILVLTVMSVAVLMITGVGFLTLATAEYRMSSFHSQTVQAFYAAEAGLNWGKKYLADNIASLIPDPEQLGEAAEFTLPFDGSPQNYGTITVKLRKQGAEWDLIATSTVRSAKQVVIQKALVQGGSVTLPDFTLYLPPRPPGTPSGDPSGTVNLANSGTTITGDLPVYGVVYVPSYLTIPQVVEPPVNPTPEGGEMGPYSLPPFVAPSLTSRGNLTVHNSTATISSAGSYNNVSVTGWPCTLNIDATNPSFKELTINHFKVNNAEGNVNIKTGAHGLDIWLNSTDWGGNSILNISGPGKVRIFIQQSFDIDGTFYINYSRTEEKNKWVYTPGNSDQLTMYYYGSDKLTIGGNTHLCGSLISGPGELHLKTPNAVIGHVVSGTSGTVTIGPDGGSDRHVTGVVYAPYAHVHLDSGRVTGAIVANSAALTGTANLHLSSYILTDFTGFFIDVGGTSSGGGGGSGGGSGSGGGTTISFGSWQGR